MRVSENTNYLTLLRDLQTAETASSRAQSVVASGRKVLKPSDNPLANSDILRLSATDIEAQQYERNLGFARSRLLAADTALDSVEGMTERIRTVALLSIGSQAGSQHYVQEIEGLRDQLLATANTTHQGTYIFGGSELRTAPFVKDAGGAVSYQGNSTALTQQVSRTLQLQMQVPGNEVFAGTVDIFQATENLVAAINAGDASAIDQEVRILEQFAAQVAAVRGRVGSTINAAESVQTALAASTLSRAADRSEIEAADLAQAISELTRTQTSLQATLAAGARLSQLTLLDYLK